MSNKDFWNFIAAVGALAKVYQIVSGHSPFCGCATCNSAHAATVGGLILSILSES